VPKTTVLIGVNPCLEECNLKKQSQFAGGENGDNSLLIRSYDDLRAGGGKKTKPIQSQTKPI